MNPKEILKVNFRKGKGLVPVVIQDYRSGKVLMLAYQNKESLRRTLTSGETWFYSRSRKKLWHKGENSGHVQKVKDIKIDCDFDTLLIKVQQIGKITCHRGTETCFDEVKNARSKK